MRDRSHSHAPDEETAHLAERRQAEEALRESEQRYRMLFESMLEGFAYCRMLFDDHGHPLDWIYLTVNRSFERLTGLKDVAGRRVTDIIPGIRESTPELFEIYGRVALTGQPESFEIDFKPLGLWLNITVVSPAREHFVAVFEDITPRIRAEEALAHERYLMRTLMDNIPDSIYFKDMQGRFLRNSRSHAELLGLNDPQLAVGRTDFDFFGPEHAQAAYDDESGIIRTGKPIVDLEELLDFPDRPTRWVSATKMPLRDPAGTIIGTFGISRDITERKRAEEQIRQQLATLTALYSGAQELAGNLDSRVLSANVARTCVESFGVRFAWVVQAESDGRVSLLAQFPPEASFARQARVRYDDTPEGRGAIGQAIRSGSPVVLARITAGDPNASPWRGLALEQGYRSVAAFPLISRHKVFGALALYSDQPDYFTPERVQFFQSYALLAAAAMENARLFEQTERRLSGVQALHKVDIAISSSFNLRLTLDVVLEQAVAQLEVDAAAVLLLDPHSHMLNYAAGRGFRTAAVQNAHIRLGGSYAGRAALERHTIIGDAPQGADRGLSNPLFLAMLEAEGFVAHIVTPLVAKGQVKGVLEVYRRTALGTDDEWLAFLETLAGQAAIAIESASLFDGLQRVNIELELAYDSTLEGWARALELRDGQTEGHCRRVTDYAVQLAQAVGMHGRDLAHLRRGALLHDIGKMGVPDSILRKPGPLSAEEQQIMHRHPILAHDMLWPIHYLRPAIDIPYCHHEKWDGTGYPRGLKGEEIPLAARIFAVVDVWDALRSERPYSPAWPEDKVLAHIRSLAGTHFDPQVVEAFLMLDLDAPARA